MSMTQTHEENSIITEEELRGQIKPLSQNAFVRFFQKLYRKWLEKWYAFSSRHEKGASLLQKAFFFLVFSVGVTIWQYVVMTFLPYAFAKYNAGAWGWPNIPVPAAGGQPYMIFGDAQGLGYFIAFEIAVFTAQCINFPLQRNITYRSHGNPFVQAVWYFIGWALISVFTNALWGICNAFLVHWGVPDAVTGIGKTMLTGIFSMAVFFFIFLIIFPDNVKLAKKARKRVERKKEGGMSGEGLSKLESKAVELEKKAALSEAEKRLYKAASQSSSGAMRYFSLKPNAGETEEQFASRKQAAFERACEAAKEKQSAEAALQALKNEK